MDIADLLCVFPASHAAHSIYFGRSRSSTPAPVRFSPHARPRPRPGSPTIDVLSIAHIVNSTAHSSPSSNDQSELDTLDFPAPVPEFKFPASAHEEGGLYSDSLM